MKGKSMKPVSQEAKKGIKEVLTAVINDPFPTEMKVKYLTEHFVAILEHLDEKDYQESVYGPQEEIPR